MLTEEIRARFDRETAKYPADQRQSAVMACLAIVQQVQGWVSLEAEKMVADYLGMPPIAVHEVTTFYNMYNQQPVGTYKLNVCTNLPCALRDGEKALAQVKRGAQVYAEKCASCHGADGQGLPIPESARDYPPLWGDKSYNEGAGLFRLSRFAGYVKANMPFGATHLNPQLSDEEAWDVAAFVNSKPRPPHPFLATDWPKIEKKPYDHPFGPFADTFPAAQHKYGPFGPIAAFYQTQQKKN